MAPARQAPRPADILIVAPPDESGAVRRALVRAGIEPRHAVLPADAPPGPHDLGRPDLMIFPRVIPSAEVAERIGAVRDALPEIPIVLVVEEFSDALTDALRARDIGFVTVTVLERLVVAVEHGIRHGWEHRRRLEAESEVRRQRSRLRSLIDEAPDLIAEFDGDLRYTMVNAALTTVTARPEEAFLRRRPSEVGFPAMHDRDWDALLREVLESARERTVEFSHSQEEGRDLHFEARLSPETDGPGRARAVIMVARDITERLRRERLVEHMARHDPLTELPNRRVLEERLEEAHHRAERGTSSVLLFADVDDFKVVNDEAGHGAGDRLLVQLAAILPRALRPMDLVARTGGDEFALLVEDAGKAEGMRAARRLRNAVNGISITEGDFTFSPSLTVGGAVIDPDASAETSPAEHLGRAELAMRRGKAAGKNREVFYSGDWGAETTAEGRGWMSRLRAALAENRFEVFLQPIVFWEGPEGQGPTEYEALVRLRENGTVLSPRGFISVAERFGLASRIDEWMIASVLKLLDERKRGIRIAVNLSAGSVGSPRIHEYLSARRSERADGLEGLVLELTETAAVRHFGDARAWMESIRELGAAFSLDDFGTGFGSFAYLRSLPVDTVKIDGGFVEGILGDGERQAIVRSMVDVSHALAKTVVAEWVEDGDTLLALRGYGVDGAQGFYLQRPRPAAELLA